MIHASGREWIMAATAALSFHLLLFLTAAPTRGSLSSRPPAPPRTWYLHASSGAAAGDERAIHAVRSPVLFSLPSAMGFSKELLNHDVLTRLSFLQSVKTEQFLKEESISPHSATQLVPVELMISGREKTPALPVAVVDIEPPRMVATRVVLAPELKSRLIGGVVLPPELNRAVETPWEVHASISVSAQGAVSHVLLEQPLESPERNQQVLRLLYGLRFKAGEPVESSIDIYSPEAEGGRIQ
jgi:hypothetical protein